MLTPTVTDASVIESSAAIWLMVTPRSPPRATASIRLDSLGEMLLPCAAFSEFSSILRTASNASSNSSDSRLAYRTSIRRTSSADLNRADQNKLLR